MSYEYSELFCFETWSPYVAQADFELAVFPAQPPECWDLQMVTIHAQVTRAFLM